MSPNILQQFDLSGRKAFVTGGSGGLGRAMAEALYEAGADLAINARSESIHTAAAEIGAGGRAVRAVQADLSDSASLARAFDETLELLGGLDILVTCHGALHNEPALRHDHAGWARTLQANLTAVFELNQLAGRVMVAQGRGKIINVASMLSFSGGLNVVSYAASKGGVAQLTKALANEWSSKGVNVNAIAPGYIRTTLNQHIWADPARNEQILARLPSGRWGEPADLKGATVFLASPASDYVHGVIFPVDGGWLAR